MDYDCKWRCQKKLNNVNPIPLIREFCNRQVVNKKTAYAILNRLSELQDSTTDYNCFKQQCGKESTHNIKCKHMKNTDSGSKNCLSVFPQYLINFIGLHYFESPVYFSSPKEERKFSMADCKREVLLGTFTSCPFYLLLIWNLRTRSPGLWVRG